MIARWDLRKSRSLLAVLLVASAIPILVSMLRMGQILGGALPAESLRFAVVPAPHFMHALAGVLFGLIGPVQLTNALRGRYGRLHRVLGRVFVGAGLLLAASALRLLWQFPAVVIWPLTLTRLMVALGLGFALIWAVRAARRGAGDLHRAWMIRAYALGVGAVTQAVVMLPIAALGGPVTGPVADWIFIGTWVFNLCLAEWVIRR